MDSTMLRLRRGKEEGGQASDGVTDWVLQQLKQRRTGPGNVLFKYIGSMRPGQPHNAPVADILQVACGVVQRKHSSGLCALARRDVCLQLQQGAAVVLAVHRPVATNAAMHICGVAVVQRAVQAAVALWHGGVGRRRAAATGAARHKARFHSACHVCRRTVSEWNGAAL